MHYQDKAPGSHEGETGGPSTALRVTPGPSGEVTRTGSRAGARNRHKRPRRAGAVFLTTVISRAYRAERRGEEQRYGDPLPSRMALGLVVASGLFLILAAVLGEVWPLGVAIGCGLGAAALAAYAE